MEDSNINTSQEIYNDRLILARQVLDQGKYDENGDEIDYYHNSELEPKYEGYCDFDCCGAMIEFSDMENKSYKDTITKLEQHNSELKNIIEFDYSHGFEMEKQVEELQARNKKLVEALENICNEGNGTVYDVDDDPDRYILNVDKIALEALK